jgi:hypothetical protein
VAGGEYEAIAVGPVRRRGIVLEELRPEDRRDIGHAHRHAGMTGFRFLHGIHCERAQRIRHIAMVQRCLGRGKRGRAAVIHGRVEISKVPENAPDSAGRAVSRRTMPPARQSVNRDSRFKTCVALRQSN